MAGGMKMMIVVVTMTAAESKNKYQVVTLCQAAC